ncbi:hypothetical protein RRG08_054346 [Elysia crispata]|uniref:Uncharacterized protein n=1 Tax=Elysia crispata TaxID=231223 RepID=A0AAE1B4H5_9GAST|nr:hypothetical protein RRG08_054346 [Elysia crispata]
MLSRRVFSTHDVRLVKLVDKSLRRASSQHAKSSNIMSWPLSRVASLYSYHLCLKYVHSSLVPDTKMTGPLDFFSFDPCGHGRCYRGCSRMSNSLVDVEESEQNI